MRKQLLFTILMLLPLVASAHDIEVANVDCVTIYYNYTNNGTELAVTSGDTQYTGNVVIPEVVTYENNTYKVTSIGTFAFFCCTNLTSIEIPNSVTSIGQGAFSGCTNLTSIEIPNSVTSISSDIFYNTAWYNNQPDGLVYAGNVAYCYKGTMPSNTSLTIKEGTTAIASNAFSGCSGLTSITIPNSVTSIDYQTFYNCNKLTSINIPNSVTSIGQKAFYDCSGLSSVTIGNSVKSIGGDAFFGCTNLTSINIPNSVKSIDYQAFYNCYALTSVTIGNSVTSIGTRVFYGCYRLNRIEVLAIEPPYIENESKDYPTFGQTINGQNEVYQYAYVYIPKGTYEAYSSAYGWKNFKNIKTIDVAENIPQDVNGDGVVDTQDVLEIYKYIQEH